MVSRLTASFAFTAAALLVAACTSATGDSADTSSAQTVGSSRVHVMKKTTPDSRARSAAAAAGSHLNYFGGPVLSNVKIYAVYWGSNVQFQDHINQFFPAITNSAYFDWLKEYNTPTQQIGRGSFGGAVVDENPPSGTSVTDDQIQAEIEKLIDAGKLPPNDGNNLYMTYFPPGVSITGPQGAGSSCVEFCAYHGTFQKNGTYGFYGVMPDLGGDCATGCGDGTPENNITEVSSHEMIEAVTDGAVGMATSDGPPLAWYDSTNGEIGDICVGQAGQVAGFTIQLEWSNSLNKCTDIGGGGGTTDGGTGGTDGGTGGTCAHDICSAGGKLSSSCDPCVKKVCARDSFCCNSKWDSSCVSEVGSVCGQTCN
jgi:hypothetical protein